eukprot:GHVN01074319.1.p1 GENE.GHVN01074319.1~~GHVN01074319.1.p1  ORF type:complete len:550 (+),score=40.33 GHVN01074319.1:181-1830(+)
MTRKAQPRFSTRGRYSISSFYLFFIALAINFYCFSLPALRVRTNTQIGASLQWYSILITLLSAFWMDSYLKSGLMMFMIGLLHFGLNFMWFSQMFDHMAAVLWSVYALSYGLWGVMASICDCKLRIEPIRMFCPALLWCGMEYLRGEHTPLMSWGSIGYYQANAFGFMAAQYVGVYGIGFVMYTWARICLALLEGIISSRKRWKTLWMLLLLPLLGLPIVSMVPPLKPPMREYGTARLQQFGARDQRKADDPAHHQRVDLLVWPEYSFVEDPSEDGWASVALDYAARTNVAFIVGGVKQVPDVSNLAKRVPQNTAFVIGPDRKVLAEAPRNYPTPFYDEVRGGTQVSVVELEGTFRGKHGTLEGLKVGIGMSFDASFQTFSRRMAIKGAQLLIFPTFNSPRWPNFQHHQLKQMFQFRAAECGLQILAASNSGPTVSCAPSGDMLQQLPFRVTELIDVSLLKPRKSLTTFMRGGWLMGPICAAVGIFFVLIALISHLRFMGSGEAPEAQHRTSDQRPKDLESLQSIHSFISDQTLIRGEMSDEQTELLGN